MWKSIAVSDIPKKPAHRRAWVVYQLKLRGMSLRQLAIRNGLAPTTVSQALTIPSFHMERLIADVLGLTPEQLFPERFDAAGTRLHQVRPSKRTLRGQKTTVQNGEAA